MTMRLCIFPDAPLCPWIVKKKDCYCFKAFGMVLCHVLSDSSIGAALCRVAGNLQAPACTCITFC